MYAPITELAQVLDLESKFCRFDSCWAHQIIYGKEKHMLYNKIYTDFINARKEKNELAKNILGLLYNSLKN